MKKSLTILIMIFALSYVVAAFETNNANYSVNATSLGQQGGTGTTLSYSARFQTTAFQETRDPGVTASASAEIGWFPGPGIQAASVTPGKGGGGGNILKDGKVSEWAFIIGDGICQYTLGESRFNSRHDCRPTIFDYSACMFDKRRCFDAFMWREAIGLGLVFLLILYVLYRFRFLVLIDNEEEKERKKQKETIRRKEGKK